MLFNDKQMFLSFNITLFMINFFRGREKLRTRFFKAKSMFLWNIYKPKNYTNAFIVIIKYTNLQFITISKNTVNMYNATKEISHKVKHDVMGLIYVLSIKNDLKSTRISLFSLQYINRLCLECLFFPYVIQYVNK